MIKKYLFMCIASMCLSLIFQGCDKEDVESLESHFSYRDGVYEGKNLSVTLDGDEVSTVISVSVKSSLLEPNVDPDRDPDIVVGSSNPTYKSTIIITGFPIIGATSTFETISDLRGFKGSTTIDEIEYNYVGEFTGDPLTTHDKQGLILQFSTK